MEWPRQSPSQGASVASAKTSVVVGCMSRQTVMCDGGREPVSAVVIISVDIRIPNAELGT